MRYSQEHKAATRARLVGSSARLAKRRGFAASSVDALMKAAGLSGAGFYKHFRGKSDLLSAIVEHELARSRRAFEPLAGESDAQWRARAVQSYFGDGNVERVETGCMLPALAAEIARAGTATRQRFREGVRGMVQTMAPQVGGDAQAWNLIAQLVGAVVIARALGAGTERNELLAACREQLAGVSEREN